MPENTKTPHARVAAAVRDLLDGKALAEAEIITTLLDQGIDLGADPDYALDEALSSGEIGMPVYLIDGRVTLGKSLLRDRWFTHRVTADEMKWDYLADTDDLLPLTILFDVPDPQFLTTGGPVEFVMNAQEESASERDIPSDAIDLSGAVLLPPGTLVAAGAQVGGLVGVCSTAAGWVVQAVAADPAPRRDSLVAVLETVLADESHDPDEPVGIDEAVWSACCNDPSLFRDPLSPLDEILEEHGFAVFGQLMGPVGFDFPGWRREKLVRTIMGTHELEEEAAWATTEMVGIVELLHELLDLASGWEDEWQDEAAQPEDAGVGDSVVTPIRALAPWLKDPKVAKALLAHTVVSGDSSPAALGMFAESALEQAPPASARAGLWWLLGRVHEVMGETAEAEAALRKALSCDPNWWPALNSVARIESDRGNAGAAQLLLDRAGEEADENLGPLVSRFVVAPRTDVPRNSPCWCGSGLKYKKCHLRNESHPLADRGGWLYAKALVFMDCDHRDSLIPLALARARYSGTPMGMRESLNSDLVLDALLFEGGVFARFLSERGELLPDDERLTAQQWLLCQRSVFDVQSVRPGVSITFRDIRTGDVMEVRERTASRAVKTGMLLCSRVLPVGDTWQIFGGLEPVALHQRDDLVALLDSEPTALEIVDYLSRALAPPQLRTMEDEEVVLCEAELAVADPVALAAAFDRRYERIDDTDEGSAWIENVEVMGVDRVRASLTLSGERLTVTANSEERFERVLSAVDTMAAGTTLVTESRTPLDSLAAAAELAGQSPIPAAQPLDLGDHPELMAAVTEMIEQHERAWVDERIPALNGLTPREAAADPTRRDDVIRLLDSFPAAEGSPGVMDRERLRAVLSL